MGLKCFLPFPEKYYLSPQGTPEGHLRSLSVDPVARAMWPPPSMEGDRNKAVCP